MATTITGVSGVVTLAPASSSSSRGSRWCISSPRYGFFNLFKLYFFLLLFSLLMPVIIMLAPPLSLANVRGWFLAFYILKRGLDLHDPTSVSHLKDDVVSSNSHIFFLLLFVLFLQVIHFIFCFILSRKLPTGEESLLGPSGKT